MDSLLEFQPTPYPEVNAVLHALLAGARAVLGERFIGLYLHGSLAGGDFNPLTSDIDFIVVTRGELPLDIIPALEALHRRLWADGGKWAAKLEGAYLPQESLRRYHPNDPPRPAVNEGRFYLDQQDSAWIIQRHVLREHGVAVAGPPVREMIDPVGPEDLRMAVAGLLCTWWAPMLQEAARLRTPEYQAYAALTMARALYTLEHGAIVSKPVAARWARTALPERWRALVGRALAWRPSLELDALNEVLEFISFTIDRSLARQE